MINTLKSLYRLIQRQGATKTEEQLPDMPPDLSSDEQVILKLAGPYTMTSIDRQISLCRIIDHIEQNSVPGDFVECGVWRGGSSMIAALKFKSYCSNRKLWLYDTFDGMTTPDDTTDVAYNGVKASEIMEKEESTKDSSLVWAIGSKEEVQANLRVTGYGEENMMLVKGAVEVTIPSTDMPAEISILRLDTDWYSSTLHELETFYPLVAPGGFVLIDDYGHWNGARLAVDEYFSQIHPKPYLHRVDYTCRIIQKP